MQATLTMRHPRRAALCGLLLSCAVAGGPALADGNKSTITTTLGATAGRNLGLEAGGNDKIVRFNGVLNYAFEMQTRQTQLLFQGGIRPEADRDGNGAYPVIDFRLRHQAARTVLRFDAGLDRARVTDQSISYDDSGAILEYDGSGERTLTRFSGGIEGGLDMPFGYTLDANHRKVDYSGLSDSGSYSPSTSDDVALGLRATVSSMTQLNLDLSHERYRSENAEQTRRTSDLAMLGLTQRLNALTEVEVSAGSERIETRRLTRGTDTETGAVFSLGMTRDNQTGSYRLGYDRRLTENGTRDDVTLGREMETHTGTFSGRIGISNGESGSGDWIGSLSYATDLPRDAVLASFSRTVATNDDGDDVVVTRLSGSLSHMLSEVNTLDFGLVASMAEYSYKDTTRVDATVSYNHDLTQDTTLQAGVKLGLLKDTTEDDAKSQALFLNLTRKFERQH